MGDSIKCDACRAFIMRAKLERTSMLSSPPLSLSSLLFTDSFARRQANHIVWKSIGIQIAESTYRVTGCILVALNRKQQLAVSFFTYMFDL